MIPELIASLSEDTFAALMGQVPVATASTAMGEAYRAFVQWRAKVAYEVLIEELKSGNRLDGEFDRDTFFSLLFRYLNAVKTGAAHRNLRLMAQMIESGLSRPDTLHVSELSSLADIVSTLARDELIFLAACAKYAATNNANRSHDGTEPMSSEVINRLVPSHVGSKGEVFTIATMLMRTGFVIVTPNASGMWINLTPRFEKLISVCKIEACV